MKCIINSDILDITEWAGKKRRLTTLISKEIYQKHLDNVLPYKIRMTEAQYKHLRNTPEFGDKKEWRYKEPHDRIYMTPYNAMEVIVI